VTQANDASERLRTKIQKSEAQLENVGAGSAVRDSDGPADRISGLIGDHPALAIAIGLGLGILAGTLVPKSATRRLVRSGAIMASAAGELGLALGKSALNRAEEAVREGRGLLDETATGAGRLATDAGRRTADAGRVAADASRQVGASAQRLASDASGKARELGSEFVKRASAAASRLRH
jgi:hypothetical protein